MSLSISESVMEKLVKEENVHNIAEVLKIAKNNMYINEVEHTIIVLGTNGIEEETETLIDNVSGSCTKAKVIHNETGAFVIITMLENGSIVIGDEEQGMGGSSDTEADSSGGTNDDGGNDNLTIPEIAAGGIILEEDTTFEDENGEDITIPGGFGVPSDSEEDPLEDRDSIEEGFVIECSKGNQFVWVPADFDNNIAAVNLKAVEKDGVYISMAYYTYTSYYFTEPKYLTSTTIGDASVNNTTGLSEQNLRKEFEDMQESVVKRGGFYIMRYEMSYGSEGTAESKQGMTAANASVETSSMWWGLYELAKSYTNGSVRSTMIADSQYDILMGWVDADEISSAGRNEIGETTGTEPTDKIRNIYDLNGGRFEWTTGAYSETARVRRGGRKAGGDPSTVQSSLASNTEGYFGTRSTLIW